MHPKSIWNEILYDGTCEIYQKCHSDSHYNNQDVDIIYENLKSRWFLHEEEETEITLEDVEYYLNEVILTYSNDAKVHMDPNDYVENSQIIDNMSYEEVVKDYAIEVIV